MNSLQALGAKAFWLFCWALGFAVSSSAANLTTVAVYEVGSLSIVGTGDFNADGKADLVVGSTPAGRIALRLGNGDGTFQPAVDYDAGPTPTGIVVGDFNSDGRLDIVAANYSSSGGISVLLGTGDGTLQLPATYDAGNSFPYSVASADLNHDGRLDIVVTSPFDGISVLLGNGDGTFVISAKYAVVAGTTLATAVSPPVAIGDLNSDGNLDLVIVGSVLLGNGDGTFQAPITYGSPNDRIMLPLTLADFDHDGKLDIVTASDVRIFTGAIAAFLGNGDGTFQLPSFLPVSAHTFPNFMLTMNATQSDMLDLIIAAFYPDTTYLGVWVGFNGVAARKVQLQNPPLYWPKGALVSGDFDGDGAPDLAVIGHESFSQPNPFGYFVAVMLNLVAPKANAGPNQVVECAGPSGANVLWDGSASSDPNGSTLNFTWKDGSEKVVATTPKVTVVQPLGTQIYTLTVTNQAGFSSSALASATVRDTVAPALTVSRDNISTLLPSATANGAAINLSGIASATDACDAALTITNDAPAQFPLGKTLVTFTATDHSGNFSQKQLTAQVAYKFTRFSSPVDMGIWNNVNAGRSVPIKWQLSAADNSYVTDLGSALVAASRAKACTGGISDPLDTFVDGSTSGLHYDTVAQQYVYVWPTSKSWSGTCRDFVLQLKDGNTYTADFLFK